MPPPYLPPDMHMKRKLWGHQSSSCINHKRQYPHGGWGETPDKASLEEMQLLCTHLRDFVRSPSGPYFLFILSLLTGMSTESRWSEVWEKMKSARKRYGFRYLKWMNTMRLSCWNGGWSDCGDNGDDYGVFFVMFKLWGTGSLTRSRSK